MWDTVGQSLAFKLYLFGETRFTLRHTSRASEVSIRVHWIKAE